ncbi:MAG: GntR family transcriptional regulator [Rhodobacteraceae bacterium]|nr:GntR family transcriptional regulator [Paracoccaceae bacterium]
MEHLQPVRSLVDRVYDSLLDAICTGEMKPGDRLAQDEIAARLGVSRQPVNSAIAMLKAQRFVTERPRRGVEVAPVDRDLFQSIYQVRGALEPLAVQLATPRLTPGTIARGRDAVAAGMEAMQAGDAAAVLRADIAFHTFLYDLSGNRILADTMRLNWQHLRRSMGEVLRFPGMTAQVWKEHGRIFEAMVRGEAGEAAQAMRAHILDAAQRVQLRPADGGQADTDG